MVNNYRAVWIIIDTMQILWNENDIIYADYMQLYIS